MRRLIFYLLIWLLLTACGVSLIGDAGPTQTAPTPQVLPDPTEAMSTLMNALRAAGGEVELTADTVAPLLEPRPGRRLRVNAQPLVVYEFGSPAEADKAALTIPADGGLDSTPAHFYREGVLLVRYAGEDSALQALLTRVLGKPFAGAHRPAGQCGAWHSPGVVSISLTPSFCVVWSDPLEDETGFRLTLTYPNTQEAFTHTLAANITEFVVPATEATTPGDCQRWRSFTVAVTALTPNGEVPYGLMATDSECDE